MTTPGNGARNRGASMQLEVKRCEPGQTIYVLAIGQDYRGCFTHYYDKRSHFCPADDTCAVKRCEDDRIWKGYSAACIWNVRTGMWEPCVFEITERAEHDLRGKWKRGEIWQFRRPGEKTDKRSPVFAHRGEIPYSGSELPAEWDVIPVLVNAFRCMNVKLGKENPIPMPQSAFSFMGPPPAELKKDDTPPVSPEEWQKVRQALASFGEVPSDAKRNGTR